ncbi:alpha/beta hydrolase [Gordonia rubripertincta]|uniref:Alpha/beta hydrolase n=1 Tax=Gordonia rubripertincta TaxID=36822 RepID=A0ABT4MPG0_GORRU|nr:alpha/beta hydrolase [Gordonia rubripertincta]MCZ4548884.1 alpha/beta hydrolase [Gordonia rubripertincta]
MALSPEAQQIVDLAASRFPGSMSGMPVADLRAMLAASARPSTTPIYERIDLRVPSDAGGVPVRVYRPSPEPALPLVIWLHSGGFVVGGLDQNDEYLRVLSITAGVVVVSVDYRLAPEHRYPAALDDARAVWDWLKAGPAEVAADTGLVALAGESAGGSLTLALSQQLKDHGLPLPDAQIVFYGTAQTRVSNPECSTSLLTPEDCEWFWDQYVPDTAQRSDPYVSPALALDLTGLPPTLLATAEVDPTRDSTEEYGRMLLASGVPVEMHRYDGMMHGFATMTGALRPAADLFDRTVQFINRALVHPHTETRSL